MEETSAKKALRGLATEAPDGNLLETSDRRAVIFFFKWYQVTR